MQAQYRVERGSVIHHHHYTGDTLLEGADSQRFRVIADPLPGLSHWLRNGSVGNDYFATDERTVWFMNHPIIGCDPSTFEGFWGGQCKWGRDRNGVWCFYVDRKPSSKPMRTADPASFGFFLEELSGYTRQYARDRRNVFYYGRRVSGARPDGFAPVPKELFLPDDHRTPGIIVQPDWPSDYRRCEGVDAIWYKGRRVSGVDAASFRAIEGGFGLDRSGFWDGLNPIGRQAGREHFDLFVAARPELEDVYWRKHRESDRPA